MAASELQPTWHLEAHPDASGEAHRIELVGPGFREMVFEGSTSTWDDYYGGRYIYGFEVALYAAPGGVVVRKVDHTSHEYGGDEHPREASRTFAVGTRAAEPELLHRLNRPLEGGDAFRWLLATHQPYLEGATGPALVDDFRRLELPDADQAELFGDPGVWIVRVRRADGSTQSFRARRPLRDWSPCDGPWDWMLTAGPLARWTRGAP